MALALLTSEGSNLCVRSDSPIVKIFSHPDFKVEIISVMSSRELIITVCSSQKWKKMREICFKTALEKILWTARMRTYIPD